MSISHYQKPPLTFKQQLNLLKQKGLVIHDQEEAIRILSTISYERFKAYLVPFKSKENKHFPFKRPCHPQFIKFINSKNKKTGKRTKKQ